MALRDLWVHSIGQVRRIHGRHGCFAGVGYGGVHAPESCNGKDGPT